MTISIYSGGIKTFPCLAVDSAGGIGVGNVGTTTIVVASLVDSTRLSTIKSQTAASGLKKDLLHSIF